MTQPIPQGFRQIKKPPAQALVQEKYARVFETQGIFEPDTLFESRQTTAEKLHGRGMVLSLRLNGVDGETMVVRKYYRGGLLRHINPELYLDRNRASKELVINHLARQHNIPTAEPIAAVSVCCLGIFYRCFLITRKLDNCVDLPFYLTQIFRQDPKLFNKAKMTVIKVLANKLKLMHDKNFLHGDLNLKNILVQTDDPETLYFIDWDKSSLKPVLSRQDRDKNLTRLCRSMAKYTVRGLPFDIDDMELLFRHYWNDDKKTAQSMAALKYVIIPRVTLWRFLKK